MSTWRVSEAAALEALVAQNKLQGEFFRVAGVSGRSLQLADPRTLALARTVRLDEGFQRVPDLVYPGQLVQVDEENKTIESGAAFAPGAARLRQQCAGKFSLVVGVRRGRESAQDVLARLPTEGATHVFVLGAGALEGGAVGVEEGAVRLPNLPIVLSPQVPCHAFLADGHFLGADFIAREGPHKVLAESLRQGTLLPGAWMTGKCSVSPEALPSFDISETDLWFVTPTASAAERSFDVGASSHFRWLAVQNWVRIDLELNGSGLFRQAVRNIAFNP